MRRFAHKLAALRASACMQAPSTSTSSCASSATPLASTSSSTLFNSTSSTQHNLTQHSLPSQASIRTFWASPRALDLASTLQEEHTYELDNRRRPDVVAQGPPAPFKLTEAPGDTLLTLSRGFGQTETVTLSLHVNNQPSAEDEFEEAGAEEDEEEEGGLSTVVFNTQIAKQGAPHALVFECETDGTFVAINHISYEPAAEGHDSPSMYTGPVFDELDEGLQREFQAYLEERGVTPALGEYLRHLVHDKEESEYIEWLKKVQSFVKQ